MYEQTLPITHATTAAARVRLAQVFITEQRYVEAEGQLVAARQVLEKQPVPPIRSLQSALDALAQVFDPTQRPELAQRARAQFAELSK